MNSRRFEFESRALHSARALVDRMRSMYRELERLTGAPITLHRALLCIGNEPGLPASRLATLLGMQRPAVSHVLKSLAKRGWIERLRDARDQRSVRITITAAGRQILQATSGRAVGTLQRAVRNLSLGELAALAEGLQALLRHLPPEPAPRAARPTRTAMLVRKPRRRSAVRAH